MGKKHLDHICKQVLAFMPGDLYNMSNEKEGASLKLLRFRMKGQQDIHFGVLLNERVVSFETLHHISGRSASLLTDCETYLQNLPASEQQAKSLVEFGRQYEQFATDDAIYPLHEVQLLSPLDTVSALLDFGFSPRHLANAGETLINHEFQWPLRSLLKRFLKRSFQKEKKKTVYRYYKCNHLQVSGPDEELVWPAYTSYLDIEPELGIVIGHQLDAAGEVVPTIAGYVIYNDVSARDVQWEDFRSLCGPSTSKDFERSNGFGPYLVTPDEVENPLALHVSVEIADRWRWEGSTSEYTAHPNDVLAYVQKIFQPAAGTVIGMGTIPDCCGFDRDEWIRPGDRISITFDRLGTLTQFVPRQLPALQHSRWGQRADI